MSQKTQIISVQECRAKVEVRIPVEDILSLLKSRGFEPPSDNYSLSVTPGQIHILFTSEEPKQTAAAIYFCPLHPEEKGLGDPPTVEESTVDIDTPELEKPPSPLGEPENATSDQEEPKDPDDEDNKL